MLELKNIKKSYVTGDEKVSALKGINIVFRKNEFVSILGPSGCGKTTLLNIIGGLDKYTSGDLIINNKSTKDFSDHDWDTYRNYRVGFVFQSYNLITHQNVLKNVELALTLSGVSKKERKKRAIAVLRKVGLADQIYKKPNQMSGGQMQRVAIARALVNDPDIILADEPTGALDSETSIQVMNLLKEISNDKLIIMVTHNASLATDYSTRIIKLLDGNIIDDSNEYPSGVDNNAVSEKNKGHKTSMNLKTAFSLSLNNLLTKKGRTILTSFAGSIGIIGIALILSLSKGVDNYISRVEKDTLSTYPISLTKTSIDTGSLITSLMGSDDKKDHDNDKIYSNNIMTDMIEMTTSKIETNNLAKFKTYLDNNKDISQYVTAIQYGYNLNLQVYKQDDDNYLQVNPSNVMDMMPFASTQGMSMGNAMIWQEMIDNESFLKTQYDMIDGYWPQKYNEIVLIADENNEISDFALYSLGIKSQKELAEMMQKVMQGEKITATDSSYTYQELLNLEYKLILNTDYYVKQNNVWVDHSTNNNYMKQVIDNGITLKIVGIIKPSKEASATSMTGSVGYLKSLVDYVSEHINEQDIVKQQLDNKNRNIFTNQSFKNTESYDSNLIELGYVNKDEPATINFYANDFDSKEQIISFINSYNEKAKKDGREEDTISYNDIVGTMMNSVSSIVNTISYVLIAFVMISLVVSSIMIGIITYISVLERTKEIGILRAIGASKKDISRVFNAETVIVGLVAGALGIGITLLLNILVNVVIKSFTDISNLAKLPLGGALFLILISVLLTLIAGVIPSRVASKKDPVEALRTE